ncbi:MAG: hypothetical protein IH872_03450 [Chloroflexi bacterium]|nr:hypothetical protein [Chloroflexota bacterium]
MAIGKRSSLLAVLALALILAAIFTHTTSATAGNERICSDETISSGTFSKVIVGAGTSCTLEGSVVVEGDVLADGAIDVTISGIRVEGNIEIKNSSGTLLFIIGSDILGNLKLNHNTVNPGPGDLAIIGNTIGGNVETKRNSVADTIFIGACPTRGNVIGGNVTMENNTVDDIQLACNDIDGNVAIKANTASTDVRSPGNSVGGNYTITNNSSTRRFVVGSFIAVRGAELPANTIQGNLVVKGNTNTLASVIVGSDPGLDDGNTVSGNLTIKNNSAADEVFVKANAVDGNLKCTGNDPGPTLAGNTVGGKLDCAD